MKKAVDATNATTGNPRVFTQGDAIVSFGVGQTTRKTIEVPEDFFFRVKMRALERKMLEKESWAEILGEYFENHPTV